MSHIVGGIEGGATNTICRLYNAKGDVLAETKAGPSNIWVTGEKETAAVIVGVVHEAKKLANIDITTPLATLGLTLSGMDFEETRKEFTQLLKETDPNLSELYTVCTDAVGSCYNISPTGGLVVIAGTGSAGRLIAGNGEQYRTGGWGHAIGDEGSAYSIAVRALKLAYQLSEGVAKKENKNVPWKPVMDAAFEYFEIKDRFGILPHLYSKFVKKDVAGFCLSVVKLAQQGDQLSRKVLARAGSKLAYLVLGLLSQADISTGVSDGPLVIACVGSVWKSFQLFQSSFVDTLTTGGGVKSRAVLKFRLVSIVTTSAAGVAGMAAREAGLALDLDYESHTEQMFSYSLA